MNGDARLPAAPLQVEAQLEPGELASARAGPGFGVCATSISSRYQTTRASLKRWAMLEAPWVPKPSRFSETKMSCGLPQGAARWRQRCWAAGRVGAPDRQVRLRRWSPPCVELRRCHDELIEVIFGVVLKAVGRFAEQVAGAVEDGVIAHDGS